MIIWFLIRVGWVAVLSIASLLIHYYNPVYSFLDALFILVIGMILGAIYVEANRQVAEHMK